MKMKRKGEKKNTKKEKRRNNRKKRGEMGKVTKKG